MGEVRRYEPVVHHISGDTFADAVIDADGDYVLHSDYATLEADFDKLFEAGLQQQVEYAALEAKLAASEAACAAKDAALLLAVNSLREVGNDYPGSSCYQWCHSRADAVSAALSPEASRNWIDATGAVEGRVQKLPVPASGWAGGTSLEHVTIPREWAGSRVLIVRVRK